MAEQYILDRMTVLLAVAAIVILVAGTVYVFTLQVQPLPGNMTNATVEVPKISVSGEATRTVSPDLLIVGVAVETQNETIANAEAANAEMTRRVKSALLANGIKEKEIETVSYYTYPVYNDSCWYPPWPCRGDVCIMGAEGEAYADDATEGEGVEGGVAYPESYPMPGRWQCGQQVIGYKATHSIIVKTENIYGGGEIIDAAANTGARIDYQYFSLKEETRIRVGNELAGEAAASARQKAESIANGLGVSLGRVVEIRTDHYYPYYAERGYAVADGAAAAEQRPTTEIFPQDLTLSSYIYVAFEIAQ